MKRLLILFLMMVSFVLILTGCQSDEKQATKIHKVLEESAQLEKGFITKQNELFEIKQTAQLIYIDLVNLEFNEKNSINEKIEDGVKVTERQQELLKEASENFQEAYQLSLTIEKNIKKIDDQNLKREASNLVEILNERKKLMDTFFENYEEGLSLQEKFYQELKDENYNLMTLDQQINEINKRNQKMEEIVQQYNQYTKQFIKSEKDYYQLNTIS